MNGFEMTVVWLAVQVSLALVPAMFFHLWASRRGPTQGAWVAVASDAMPFVHEETDASGAFEIAGSLPSGGAQIHVFATGYANTDPVAVAEGDEGPITVRLVRKRPK